MNVVNQMLQALADRDPYRHARDEGGILAGLCPAGGDIGSTRVLPADRAPIGREIGAVAAWGDLFGRMGLLVRMGLVGMIGLGGWAAWMGWGSSGMLARNPWGIAVSHPVVAENGALPAGYGHWDPVWKTPWALSRWVAVSALIPPYRDAGPWAWDRVRHAPIPLAAPVAPLDAERIAQRIRRWQTTIPAMPPQGAWEAAGWAPLPPVPTTGSAPVTGRFRKSESARAAQSHAQKSLSDFRETLESQMARQAWDQAAASLASARRAYPDHGGWDVFQGRLWHAQGKTHQALSYMEQHAPAVWEQHTDYYGLLAVLYQHTGHFAKASYWYENLLRVHPEQGPWWLGLAIARESLGDRGGALAAYTQAYVEGLPVSARDYAVQRSQILAAAG